MTAPSLGAGSAGDGEGVARAAIERRNKRVEALADEWERHHATCEAPHVEQETDPSPAPDQTPERTHP